MATSGRGRRPWAEMDAPRVLDITEQLEGRSVRVWLDGGWGIDAAIERALGELGYVLAGGRAPTSFELVDSEGHQVDVHPVSFTPTGDGVYRMENGEDWIVPAHAFAGVGQVLGHELPCMTPDVALIHHTVGSRSTRSIEET